MSKTVSEIMTTEVFTVSPETSLESAIQILVEKKISGLPVIDTQGDLVGVISETDLTWQATGVDTPPHIMFLDSVIYLQNPESQLVREAARIMHEKKVRRLPVVDDQSQLVGIITQGDVIRMMASE